MLFGAAISDSFSERAQPLRFAARWPELLLHLHTLPKRQIPLNPLRSFLRLRIEPRRARVPFSVNLNIVIAGCPLPRTHRVRIACLEIFFVNSIRREILISLHFD